MTEFNAYDFKKQYIDNQHEGTFFRLMTGELNYYFFSHMHDVEVDLYSKVEVISHFYDFFSFLYSYYNDSDISRAYATFYQEISKQRTDVQSYIWSIFYSFASLMESSAELRSIRFAIEKSVDLDIVRFFQHCKSMIATIYSANVQTLVMDKLNIDPDDLSQILSAIYERKVIKKMYLIKKISLRANDNGLIASELCVVLIHDFVREKRKKKDFMDRNDLKFAEFYATSTIDGHLTPQKGRSSDEEEEENFSLNRQRLTEKEKIRLGLISRKKSKRKGRKAALM